MSPYTPEGETRERIYRYMCERLEFGRPPTLREVQAEFGFRAVETARQHLERLVEQGRLRKNPGARGYALPDDERTQTVAVPLLGRVPAGGLEEAIELREGSVPVAVPRRRGGGAGGRGAGGRGAGGDGAGGLFALRVEGESMIGVGILPGDIVIVQRQSTALPDEIRSGEIVVAMVDDEATVKTLRRTGRRVELHPENPRYKPIVVSGPESRGRELRILGKVVEVRRYLGGGRQYRSRLGRRQG